MPPAAIVRDQGRLFHLLERSTYIRLEGEMMNKMRRFLVSEDGPTAVEYAVMLSLIICVCLSAITTIGHNASSVFSKVANSIH
jgi:pilus assembly protein Flp/PilA